MEWISTNDGGVRDDHKHADGQTRPIGQPFNVGGELLMYPSDPKGRGRRTNDADIMTRNQKLKYARAVLLMQDRIALKYQNIYVC